MTEMVGEQIYQAGFDAIRRHSGRGVEKERRYADARVKTLRSLERSRLRAAVGPRRALPRRRHLGDARDQRGRRLDLDRGAVDRSARSREIRPAGARVTLGAGVTMAQIVAQPRACRSCIRWRVRSAGRRSATWRPSAAICSRRALRRLHGRAARARRDGGDAGRLFGARDAAGGVSWRSRARHNGLVAGVTFNRPPNPEAFRFRKVSRVKPKGISVLSIAAHLPMNGGRIAGARVAYGAMAPTPIRAQIGRARARRPQPRRGRHRVRDRGRGRRHAARDRRDRERMVSARDGRGASAAPADAERREDG